MVLYGLAHCAVYRKWCSSCRASFIPRVSHVLQLHYRTYRTHSVHQRIIRQCHVMSPVCWSCIELHCDATEYHAWHDTTWNGMTGHATPHPMPANATTSCASHSSSLYMLSQAYLSYMHIGWFLMCYHGFTNSGFASAQHQRRQGSERLNEASDADGEPTRDELTRQSGGSATRPRNARQRTTTRAGDYTY